MAANNPAGQLPPPGLASPGPGPHAAQTTEPPRRGKQMIVKVVMLDDTIATFQVAHKAVGQVLYDQCCKSLNLLECDYFGLEYTDECGNQCWLDQQKPIFRQIGFLPDPSFRFAVKFYTPDPGQLEEEYTRYLYALQVKRDLIHGGGAVTNDLTAALLVSYIVQADCGDFNEDDYPDHSYLSSYKFMPNQSPALEALIMENHKKHIGQTPADADYNLLDVARRIDMYGIKLHPAKDHEGVCLNLAVAHMGVLVFQNLTKINTFSWAKIRKLSFKRRRFLIKLHPEGYGYYKDTVEFLFGSRNECKNFWKKCIEHHTFFRCQRVSRRRHTSNPRPIFTKKGGSSFRYSGRTQKQVVDHVRENYYKRQPFVRSLSGGRISARSLNAPHTVTPVLGALSVDSQMSTETSGSRALSTDSRQSHPSEQQSLPGSSGGGRLPSATGADTSSQESDRQLQATASDKEVDEEEENSTTPTQEELLMNGNEADRMNGTQYKTFEKQDSLPNLPLPKLHHTLQRYLESAEPHLTKEEYAHTQSVVSKFAVGTGKRLQERLAQLALHSRNWMEKWWLDAAYLSLRQPLVPYLSFGGPSPQLHHHWPAEDGTQLERAALSTHFILEYWKMLRRQEVAVQKIKESFLCMNQHRKIFNGCRIPGQPLDRLSSKFKTEAEGDSATNIIVTCNGRIFTLEAVCDNTLLTPPELQEQFEHIQSMCDLSPPGPQLCNLTVADRDTWAKMRAHLMVLHPENAMNLQTVEDALFVVSLEESSPKNETELVCEALAGSSMNRWADKSLSMFYFKNGLVASSCDHTPYEAMVIVDLTHHQDTRINECNGKWKGTSEVRSLPKPQEINFYLDRSCFETIKSARQQYQSQVADLNGVVVRTPNMSRTFAKEVDVYADTLMQLCLQLAYYRLHKKPAPTYETASTRTYWHGRTETVRSCTHQTVAWCNAMDDNNGFSKLEKKNKLLAAAEKHNSLMRDAQNNYGCDRHLLALQLLSAEMGLPLPDLYTDPAYTKSGGGGNYILSTSFVGYTDMYGGVVPMCLNGYGCFYRIGNQEVTVFMCSWKSSKETRLHDLSDCFLQAMLDVQSLLKNSHL